MLYVCFCPFTLDTINDKIVIYETLLKKRGMFMFKSRLTAIILLFALLLTNVPFCNTVRAESSGDDIAILNAMGISAVESDGYITRGDFTVLIVQAAGIEHKGVSNELFSDISGEQSEYMSSAASTVLFSFSLSVIFAVL